jgi:hypothetical protein
VLRLLGYDGEMEAATRFRKSEPIFKPGELTPAIFEQLRTASSPLRSQDVASVIIAAKGF